MVGEITSQVQSQTAAPTKTENPIIQAGLNSAGKNMKDAVVNNGSEDAFIRSIPTLKTSDGVELSLSGNTLIRTTQTNGKPSTVKIYLGTSTRERVERLIREYSNKGAQLKMKFVDGGDIDIGHGYSSGGGFELIDTKNNESRLKLTQFDKTTYKDHGKVRTREDYQRDREAFKGDKYYSLTINNEVSDFKPARETTKWIIDSEAFEVKTGETHLEEYWVDHKGDRVDSFWGSVGLRTAKVEETEKVVNEQSKTTETKETSRISMNGLGAEKIKQYLKGSKDLDRFFLPVALKFLEGSFTKEDYHSSVYDPDGSEERNLKILQDFFAEKPMEDCKLELIFYPQTSNSYVSLRANNSKEFVSINLDRSNNLWFETSNRTDLVRNKEGPYHIQ